MRGSSSLSDMTSPELENWWNCSTFGFLQEEAQSILRRLQMSFEGLTMFIFQELKEVQDAFDRLQWRYSDLEMFERYGTERRKRPINWRLTVIFAYTITVTGRRHQRTVTGVVFVGILKRSVGRRMAFVLCVVVVIIP